MPTLPTKFFAADIFLSRVDELCSTSSGLPEQPLGIYVQGAYNVDFFPRLRVAAKGTFTPLSACLTAKIRTYLFKESRSHRFVIVKNNFSLKQYFILSIYYLNFWKVNSEGEDLSEDLKRPDLPFIILGLAELHAMFMSQSRKEFWHLE